MHYRMAEVTIAWLALRRIAHYLITCVAAHNLSEATKPSTMVTIMSLSHIASEFRHNWDRYRTYREAVRQLSALDDRQLQDIGVERGRISELVRSGR